MKIEYKCIKCNKLYHNKFDYNRHINRKKDCTKYNINKSQNEIFLNILQKDDNDDISKIE